MRILEILFSQAKEFFVSRSSHFIDGDMKLKMHSTTLRNYFLIESFLVFQRNAKIIFIYATFINISEIIGDNANDTLETMYLMYFFLILTFCLSFISGHQLIAQIIIN